MEALYRVLETDIVRATRAFERGDQETLESLKWPTGVAYDATLVARLIDHVRSRYEKPPQSDGWLASRVHAVLRMPRRIAAHRGMWFGAATGAFRAYVDWRHPRDLPTDTWWRYNGDLLRNGVSRLWWGAEMLRDGPDYSLVPVGFQSVRTYMFVSELRYSRYREAARAFARVAAGQASDAPLSDSEVQQLSILFNTYLRLDVLESHGPGASSSSREWDPEWGVRVPTWMELTSEDPRALVGPDAGYSDRAKEDAIVDWLRRLVPEARARSATRKEENPASAAGDEVEPALVE